MRRSICYCEPSTAFAGELNTWKFIYTPALNLPKGTKLRFDLATKGRNIDWEIPSVDGKKSSNVIYGTLPNGKKISPTEILSHDFLPPLFEFQLPSELSAGSTFTITMGATEGGKKGKNNGNMAQTYAQRRRTFTLQVNPPGRSKVVENELFSIDVRGTTLATIKIITPSYVIRNKRFDIVVRFEDQYGNLTSNAPDETLIELSHEHLRENLSWRLFVPETGFLSLPNLYFNEPGIYSIKLKNLHTKEVFSSPPIQCFPENGHNLYWGLLHGESERVDSTENIEACLRHLRDEIAINFFALSPFENVEETPNDVWKNICQHIADFDENERFTTFTGFQWQGSSPTEGLRQIIYAKEQKQPLLRAKDVKYNSLKKIYKSFSPKEILSIPCFTMSEVAGYNFDHFNPDFERVVEIYNSWGSSECSKKNGNPLPIRTLGRSGMQEHPDGAIQKALRRNMRFGFVAGGLDDRGSYSGLYESEQVQYSSGMTAIIASEQTRAALFEALYNRRCYATTGKRIILSVDLASMPMGSEISSAHKHGLLFNRHLSGTVAGTADLKSVEIIRNGEVIEKYTPKSYTLTFAYDDMVPLEKVVHNAKDKKPPFVYYYIRVIQVDGHMAWSSPIWVDYVPSSAKGKSIVKLRPPKAIKPSTPPSFPLDDEDLEEDEEDTDEVSELE